MRGDAVLAHAQHHSALFRELRIEFAERAGLFGAARSVVPGIEIEHDLLAAVRLERMRPAILIGQGKGRGLDACGQHEMTSFEWGVRAG